MIRRLAKLTYWALTFQLVRRLRERRAVQRIRESGAFDLDYYREHNPDAASHALDPIYHYIRHGAGEGRDPSPSFDTKFYLAQNPDVRRRRANPLDHFLSHGWREQRQPHPDLSSRRFLRRHPQLSSLVDSEHGPAAPAPQLPSSDVFSLSDVPWEVVRRSEPDDPVVIVVSHELPFPPRAGNQYRIYRYIAWLQERGYQVITVHCPITVAGPSEEDLRAASHALDNLVVCHRDGRMSLSVAPHWRSVLGELAGQRVAAPGLEPQRFPQEAEDDFVDRSRLELTFCPDALAQVLLHLDSHIAGRAVVITAYVFVTRYLSQLRSETLRIIDTIDVFSSKEDKVDAFGVRGELSVTVEQERALLLRADYTMAIQAREAAEFEKIAPERPVVTIGVDYDCLPLRDERRAPSVEPTIVLIASSNAMNVKGTQDFLRYAWPMVRREHPRARVLVAGAVSQMVSAEEPGVHVLGFVDSLRELYEQADIVINPTAAGTGLKIKTLESLAHYRRIVAWPLGVDGVPKALQRFCSVAHDWYEFALFVSKALADPSMSQFSDADREFIAQALSPSMTYRDLGEVLDAHCRASVRRSA